MGCGGSVLKNNSPHLKASRTLKENENQRVLMKEKIYEKIFEADYAEEATELINLAFAFQKEEYSTNIELSLACKNLAKMDAFSETDAMVVVHLEKDGKWEKIGKTEVIPDSSNPKFMKTFITSYNFEKKQNLKFEIYDVDFFQEEDNLSKQVLIGKVEINLHELIFSPTQTVSKSIISENPSKKRLGTLTIKSSEYDITSSKYFFRFGVKTLNSKIDFFLKLYALNDRNDYTLLADTDGLKGNRNKIMEWNPFYVNSNKVDENDLIKIEICQYSLNKNVEILGEMQCELIDLLERKKKSFEIYKANHCLAEIIIIEARKSSRRTFLNYFYSGTKISLIIGIDFSKANKDQNLPDSLHNLTKKESNDYIAALSGIVGILQYYDDDNKIPCYGISGKLPPFYETISQSFALNGDYFNPEVYGLERILKLYEKNVNGIKFAASPVLSPVLKVTRELASNISEENERYYILCIFTAGYFVDLDNISEELEKLYDFPVSIIIVGIGDGKGKNSNGELVSYFQKLKDFVNEENIKSEAEGRNILSFIEFNQVKASQEKIAQAALTDLPKQFLKYVTKKNIQTKDTKGKDLKANPHDFMRIKIEEKKKKDAEISIIDPPVFLMNKKREFIDTFIEKTQSKDEDEHHETILNFLLNEKIPSTEYNLIFEILNDAKNKIKISDSLQRINSKKVISIANIIKHRRFRLRKKERSDALEKIVRKTTQKNEKNLDSNNDKRNEINYSIEQSKLNENNLMFDVNHLKCTYIKENNEIIEYWIEKKSKNIKPKELITTDSKIDDKKINLKPSNKIKTKVFKVSHKTNMMKNDDDNMEPINLMKESLCLLCYEKEYEILNLPCCHLSFCRDCFDLSEKVCLVCDLKIRNHLPLFEA